MATLAPSGSLPSRLPKLVIVAILILAVFMASIPHWNYSYPLHIDEWWHLGDSVSLAETGHVPFPNFFEAGTHVWPDRELGFHLLLSQIKISTGASWLVLPLILPSLILAILVVQLYALGRREGWGLWAAFIVALIPTTTRFLGPAFLVPVAVGLVFIPATMFVLRNLMNDWKGLVILLVMFTSLMLIHPPSLVALSAIVAVHSLVRAIPVGGRQDSRARRTALAMALLGSTYIIMWVWAPDLVRLIVEEGLDPNAHISLPPISNALSQFGYIPFALAALGTAVIAYRGNRDDWALVLSVMLLLGFQTIYPILYLGPDIVYERGWLYIYVLTAMLAGISMRHVWQWTSTAFSGRMWALGASRALAILVLIGMVSQSIYSHLREPYYQVIDDSTYEEFLWIRDNVPSEYDVALVDTGLAWAFATVTEKAVYAAEVAPNFHEKGRAAMEFLAEGAEDTEWLRENGIRIVYTSEDVNNEDLSRIRNNTYLLLD